MAADPPSSVGRKPRADAERNRQRLLEAAKACFARDGAGASLEEIARVAGVGIGTLYRHFPTRDALLEEVYRRAVAQLGEAAQALSGAHPPVEALRLWLLVFVDYLAEKKLMAAALTSLTGGTAELYAASGQTLRDAISGLTERAVASGEIELSVEPFDILYAIGGLASAEPGWEASAKAMVDILVAGMKRRAP